jgi:nucleolar protein 14
MAGGSALTKLKSSLHSTNSASNSRSNKGGKKTRSSVSQAYKSSKNAEVAAKLNSFDTIEEKKKFKVVTRGGKLEKGIIKNEPGKSRAAGIELRQRTLLPQLLARNHTSTFIDHRFGETSSSTLSLEEKALERFTAERTSRLSKKTRFNLEDAGAGDGRNNDEGLTHGGRKLGFGDEDELDAGGWGGGAMMNDGGVINSNREPLIGRRMAEGVNEEEEPARKRSKAEIMMEVVAKSKAYKVRHF